LGTPGMSSQHNHTVLLSAAPVNANAHAHGATQIAFFMHTVHTKANSIRFAHQSLCSPCISTLLKAIKCGYLKGGPNLTAHGNKKYLNPSPATAKGHMWHPRQGICSTHCIPPVTKVPVYKNIHSNNDDVADDKSDDSIPMHHPNANGMLHANIIESNNDSEANIFVFAAFAEKRTTYQYTLF
jgi:hypothetical protein